MECVRLDPWLVNMVKIGLSVIGFANLPSVIGLGGCSGGLIRDFWEGIEGGVKYR